VGGSAIQWLRDGLKIISASPETEKMARSLASNDSVYFVPALTGLGAPYWDPSARGMIIGVTRGTRREHFARAALEGIAYQVRDVVDEMKKAAGISFRRLRVDGGASKNDFLMQFQADILPLAIERPVVTETTAFGAAGIAGIFAGFWTKEKFMSVRRVDRVFCRA
jgi:Glycerol kinase